MIGNDFRPAIRRALAVQPSVRWLNTYITPKRTVNTETVDRLSWLRGFQGVAGLARHIGRSRNTVWRAVRWPDQFGPTFKLIEEALAI